LQKPGWGPPAGPPPGSGSGDHKGQAPPRSFPSKVFFFFERWGLLVPEMGHKLFPAPRFLQASQTSATPVPGLAPAPLWATVRPLGAPQVWPSKSFSPGRRGSLVRRGSPPSGSSIAAWPYLVRNRGKGGERHEGRCPAHAAWGMIHSRFRSHSEYSPGALRLEWTAWARPNVGEPPPRDRRSALASLTRSATVAALPFHRHRRVASGAGRQLH